MPALTPLLPDQVYHLYNRGNNHENLFREERNYRYFLELYARHVHPVVDTYAYCLMPNHFHLMVRVKTEAEWRRGVVKTSEISETSDVSTAAAVGRYNPTQNFANLFNAYTKSINKAYDRTGKLFQEHFKRIVVDSLAYFTNLVFYIHSNPQKHGFVKDFREWPWSSWHALIGNGPTRVQREMVLRWFRNSRTLSEFHQGVTDEKLIAQLIEDDFE